MENFINQLTEIAKQINIPFDEVFTIAYDYGFIDEFGNITPEVSESKREDKNPL